jgi:hypothetical protein
MSRHGATLRVVDVRRRERGIDQRGVDQRGINQRGAGERVDDRGELTEAEFGRAAGFAPGRPEGGDPGRDVAPRAARARRRPPSGARLLRVSRARPDCPPDGTSMPLGWTVILGAVVFLSVLGLGLLANAMPTTAPVPETTTVLWVRGGESLWEVAQRAAPDVDRDAVIDRIRELNGLGDALVRPGQPLLVPTAG